MRRDLLVTALIFTVIGFIAGMIYSRETRGGSSLSPQLPAQATTASEASLPEGHPPIDLAERWRALQQQAEDNPRDPRAAVELANFLFDIERWDDAIFWYRRTLELEPQNTDARTDLGTCYYNRARYDEAIAEYTQALEHEPGKPQALYGLAMAGLRGKQDRAGARRILEQLRRSHPEFPGVELLAEELGEGRANR